MEHDISGDDISSDDFSDFEEYHEHESKIKEHLLSMIALKLNGTYEVLA